MRRAIDMLAAIIAVLAVPPACAVEIGDDGGITITVSFEVDPADPDSIEPPLADPLAKTHYCDSIRELSTAIYKTTEGKHWIKRVRFYRNALVRDVVWRYMAAGGQFGTASLFQVLYWTENGLPAGTADPYDETIHGDDIASAASNGRGLNHEMGHFFYGLPDEYINFKGSVTGHTGICEESYSVSMNVASGTVCDEDAAQCSAACVMRKQCIAGEDPAGTACVTDGECGAGGICLGTESGRDDQLPDEKQRICLADTNLTPDDDKEGVCLMAGGGHSCVASF